MRVIDELRINLCLDPRSDGSGEPFLLEFLNLLIKKLASLFENEVVGGTVELLESKR